MANKAQSRTERDAEKKKIEKKIDSESDANPFSGTAPYGHAKVRSSDDDFTRNKNGPYGGVPKVRDPAAPGEPKPKK